MSLSNSQILDFCTLTFSIGLYFFWAFKLKKNQVKLNKTLGYKSMAEIFDENKVFIIFAILFKFSFSLYVLFRTSFLFQSLEMTFSQSYILPFLYFITLIVVGIKSIIYGFLVKDSNTYEQESGEL